MRLKNLHLRSNNFFMKKLLFSLTLIPAVFFAQGNYYSGTEGLSGYALKTKLHEIISQKYINWHYGDLQNIYGQTDLDQYYDHDATNTTYLLDIYSENPTGPDAYEYTTAQMGGGASEGSGWNREHMMPQSTFYGNYPMYSDLFYVIPADARINQLRSNYPYGKVGSIIYYTFSNGSRIGNSAIPGSAYTGRVYEPIDEFKGDVARALLYFAVRYEGKLSTFNFAPGTTAANDTNPLDGTEERAFDPAYINLLKQWCALDPVSQREKDRNDIVYSIQKNRNPFIDHPEWVNMIWSETPDAVAPLSPINLNTPKISAYFVNLSWTPTTDSDVLGYRIYQNGVLVATTKNTSISMDRLSPATSYTFTVRAFDKGYLESANSNALTVTTLASDIYAKDLIITKYLEGTGNNRAIEVTNKTGHPVDLNNYRLSIQFKSSTSYYFPAPYEFESTLSDNENFVIINPNANFSCFDISQARFVTAAPQLTFTGSNYLELRYKSETVDAVGTKDMSNSATLGNVSLYRVSSVNQPSATFNLSEWDSYPTNYCKNLGVLAAHDVVISGNEIKLYPNPVSGGDLYAEGMTLEHISSAKIFDMSGKVVLDQKEPFKTKKSLDVSRLSTGVYILYLDEKSFKFIKK